MRRTHMLAKTENLPIAEQPNKAQVKLQVVENKTQPPEGLLKIRAMLNGTIRSPAYLYNKVLTKKQRVVLCYAAGLTRNDISRSFEELSENSRIELQKAILLFGRTYEVFSNANVLSRMEFIASKPQCK